MNPASAPHERSLMRPAWALAISLMLLLAACGGSAQQTTQRHAAGTTTTARRTTTTQTVSQKPVPRPPFRVGLVSLSLSEPTSAAIATTRTPTGTWSACSPTVVRYPAIGRPMDGVKPAPRLPERWARFRSPSVLAGLRHAGGGHSWLAPETSERAPVMSWPLPPIRRTDPTSPGGPTRPTSSTTPAPESRDPSLRK